MHWNIPVLLAVCWAVPSVSLAQTRVSLGDFGQLADQLRSVALSADREEFETLLAPGADVDAARDFASNALREAVTQAVVIPRFLVGDDDENENATYELTVEVFTETGNRGRLQTWTLGVSRDETDPATPDVPRP